MKSMAWIPARKGSTRIPHKNVLPFCGRPLVEWSILQAIDANVFDDIIVSTDDEDVVDIAAQYNVIVQRRSPRVSGDVSVTLPFEETIESFNRTWDTISLLQPTSPLKTPTEIRESLMNFNYNEFDACLGVTPEPLWMWSGTISEDGIFEYKFPSVMGTPSQSHQTIYIIDFAIFHAAYPAITDDSRSKYLMQRFHKIKPNIRHQSCKGEIDTQDQWNAIEAKMKTHILTEWTPCSNRQ